MTNPVASADCRINPRLLVHLRCPACKAGTIEQSSQDSLTCQRCGLSFAIIDGIADLRWFPQDTTESTAFNNQQAQYESHLHDQQAQTDYEESVIHRYGDKTEAMARGWARDYLGPFLDFGCGTGQISRCLKQTGAELYGFDISPVSVRKNVTDNGVLGVVANAFYVPFKDRSFQTVCCNGVLHHIVDLDHAITEMTRVSALYVLISECAETSYHPRWLEPVAVCVLRCRRTITKLAKAILRSVGLLDRVRAAIATAPDRPAASPRGHNSKYERGLDPYEVAALLDKHGFKVRYLRFWTNIDWRHRSRLKRILIRLMVSRRKGTHFEIHAART